MRGFTLVEVLVAVCLFSVISLALYNTYFLSERAISGMDDYMWKLQESRELFETMRKEVESSFYSTNKDMGRFRVIDRDTRARQTSGIYMTTFAGAGTSYKHVAYYVEEQKNKKLALYKSVQPSGANIPPVKVEVVDNIRDFTVEVFDDSAANIEPGALTLLSQGRLAPKVAVKTWDTVITARMPTYIRTTLTIYLRDAPLTLSETFYPRITRRF
ncbi:MAG: prepilin-type N-terminal cleavage/methylation domain-containing protein [Candidatus Magnetobacterium sp. LHC-1]|uniref:Prepilin-type N-terminal cleavage/methylation domain-containing protein n=1 Tax=Candidatus Magnetobacterium casense TaxID=1455061 RepID=A0ABS6RUZ8_9BACT|nr:prepilin-type N-terminal cleavage/methylation domain-containing protein [Candidatus Magnetobacterium casensis]MBF0608144.1 prepilin-type N-terminal cleavage/methylation domain-containing protein [Nitrospirota bacterium]MBV6340406.1 prepilin-type N-terminal cleavage/methylation domain-containing protein [Candidatus Magnetobacterium casensis]